MGLIYNAHGVSDESNNLLYETDYTICYGPVHKSEVTEINFNKDTITVGCKSFMDCPGLEVINSNGSNIHTIYQEAFKNCTSLRLVNLCAEKISNEVFKNSGIPAGIKFHLAYTTEIGNNAFENVIISQLDLPRTVEHIGKEAFLNSIFKDTKFFIPPKVTEIGESAFKGTNLTDVYLPDNCKIVGDLFSDEYKFKIHMSKELFDELEPISSNNIVIENENISLDKLLDRYTFKQLNDKIIKKEQNIDNNVNK